MNFTTSNETMKQAYVLTNNSSSAVVSGITWTNITGNETSSSTGGGGGTVLDVVVAASSSEQSEDHTSTNFTAFWVLCVSLLILMILGTVFVKYMEKKVARKAAQTIQRREQAIQTKIKKYTWGGSGGGGGGGGTVKPSSDNDAQQQKQQQQQQDDDEPAVLASCIPLGSNDCCILAGSSGGVPALLCEPTTTTTGSPAADNNNHNNSKVLFDEEEDEGAPECSVCLETFHDDDIVCEASNTGCPHVFHEACMAMWLMKQTSCPICRRAFLSLDG